jgi:hypothetical protein
MMKEIDEVARSEGGEAEKEAREAREARNLIRRSRRRKSFFGERGPVGGEIYKGGAKRIDDLVAIYRANQIKNRIVNFAGPYSTVAPSDPRGGVRFFGKATRSY